jgi:hypothetical protein
MWVKMRLKAKNFAERNQVQSEDMIEFVMVCVTIAAFVVAVRL